MERKWEIGINMKFKERDKVKIVSLKHLGMKGEIGVIILVVPGIFPYIVALPSYPEGLVFNEGELELYEEN